MGTVQHTPCAAPTLDSYFPCSKLEPVAHPLPLSLRCLQVVERCRELRSMLGMSPEEAVELLATYPPLVGRRGHCAFLLLQPFTGTCGSVAVRPRLLQLQGCMLGGRVGREWGV